MKLLPLSLALLLGSLLPGAAAAGGGSCPTAGACHLPRWAPGELPAAAHFGLAVDLQGETAVVGAPMEDAVYVYRLEGGQWELVQRLECPGAPGANFGEALRLDGDELVVGAPLADVVGGGFFTRAGLVYVFERTGLLWSQTDTLSFSLPTPFARFGTSVDKLGDRIAVGSPSAWYTDVGAVAVFDRDGAGWSETVALTAPDTLGLGSSVTLDGSHVVAGDGVNETLGEYAGRVYAWEDTGAGWTGSQAFPAPGIGGGAFLGFAVAADGGWVAAGAYGSGSSGEVLLYRRDAATGGYEHAGTLAPCAGGTGSRFGQAIDLDGDRLVVGASLHFAPGPPGGRAYVYRLQTLPAASWELEVVLGAEDAVAWDAFGRAVAVDGELVLAGASDADAPAWDSGAAYLISLQGESVPGGACPCDGLAGSGSYGAGKPGTAGIPQLELLSPPVIGEGTAAQLSGALPGAQPFLVWGLVPAALPFDGGELYVADPHLLPMPAVSPAGTASAPLDVPDLPALCGAGIALQALFVDPGAAGPLHTAQTGGLLVTFGY